MKIDDRYVSGHDAIFQYLDNADHSEFYDLKEKAKRELSPEQLDYLFDPTEHKLPKKWWDIKTANYRYDYDCYGFRKNASSVNFENITREDWKQSYVCLGCSWTFGIGIPAEYTWTRFLNTQHNLKCLNMGVPGAGIQTQYRLLKAWIEYFGFKPKGVLIAGWFMPRLEIFEESRYIQINLSTRPNNKELINEVKTNSIFKTYRKKLIELKEEYDLDVYRVNPDHVYHMIDYTHTTVAEKEYFKHNLEFLKLKGLGFDLSHPSIMSQQLIANAFQFLIQSEDKYII